MAEMDHLVLGAETLEAGAAFVEQRLGVRPSPGGRHEGVGTHNVLLGHLSSALLRLMHDNIRLNLGELKAVPAASALLRRQHSAMLEAIRDKKPQAARAAAEMRWCSTSRHAASL